uniref:Putative secreted protein ovary overexpressed n=1 Tax=Rhipicephalus microplus TaxID=6941 RepID=A0A6M2DBB2_RHIMP
MSFKFFYNLAILASSCIFYLFLATASLQPCYFFSPKFGNTARPRRHNGLHRNHTRKPELQGQIPLSLANDLSNTKQNLATLSNSENKLSVNSA